MHRSENGSTVIAEVGGIHCTHILKPHQFQHRICLSLRHGRCAEIVIAVFAGNGGHFALAQNAAVRHLY